METLRHREYCFNILVQNCRTMKQYDKLAKFLRKIEADPESFSLVEPYEAFISTKEYELISKLIWNKENTVIVDCGCGEGLQQLLFQDCKKYIGIDLRKTQEILTDNAFFIQGDVGSVLDVLEFSEDDEVIGISVHCGMCFDNVRNAMYKKFNKVINV